MSVLVVGGAGFIGSRVISRLVARGERVICMDIAPGATAFVDSDERVEIVRGDVTEFDDVMRTAADTQPDRMMNLAYLLAFGADPHAAMRLNVLGLDNCLEAARLCEIGRVVYASSVAVSGAQVLHGERMVDETDPTHGDSQYAMHKIFNEWQARDFVDRYGMSITGVRPAHVIGPDKVRGSMDLVQCMTGPACGEPVTFPHADLMRLPIHVDDVAEVLVQVLLADTPRYDMYNTGGWPIDLGEFAELVRELAPEARIDFEHETGGKDLSATYLVDNSRLLQEFDIAYPPLRQRVMDVMNDVRAREGLPALDP